MRLARHAYLAILIAFIILTAALPAQQPGGNINTAALPAEAAQPPSHGAYPEIVRLSLVQGDVRITRGKQDQKLTGNTWEQAAAGIPLQSGFNLVTGSGHAEIEFEDASTLYLAPNSALSLSELTTKDGVPHTVLSLLSGTITTHLHPNIAGERYLIHTSVYTLDIGDGQKNDLRITSYLDGMKVTPQATEHLEIDHVKNAALIANTTYVYTPNTVFPQRPVTPDPFAAWDAWVAARIHERAAAMREVMQQAGLTAPLPGLADLKDRGNFIPCAPYGTCWQPTHGWAPPAPVHQQVLSAQAAPDESTRSPQAAPAPTATPVAAQYAPLAGAAAPYPLYAGDPGDDGPGLFPCFQPRLWFMEQYEAAAWVYSSSYLYPFDWAVCHAGFWINRQHHYLWVVGTHKHHRCPIRWVKDHGHLGYVPLHPRDQRGRLPLNLRHGLYVLPHKAGGRIEHIAYNPKSPPSVLPETPKQFRNPALPQLARAEAPHINASELRVPLRSGMASTLPARSSALTFDRKSQRFMLATRLTEGGRTFTTRQPFTGRSGAIRSAGSYAGGSFHGGFNNGSGRETTERSYAGNSSGHPYSGGGASRGGGSSSGGYHGGGGFSGGGGSHGGGFSGGGGGGGSFHGGGGGSTASTSSSASSSSSGGSHR